MLNHLTQQQAQFDPALGLLFEQLIGNQALVDVLATATHLLQGLITKLIDFTSHQRSWHCDIAGFQHRIHNAVLQLVAAGAFHFALHIARHFLAEGFHTALGHSEAGKELLIHFRQGLFTDGIDSDIKFHVGTGQFLVMIFLREFQWQGDALSCLLANQAFFKAGDHTL